MNKTKSHIFTLVTVVSIAGIVGFLPVSAMAKTENKIVGIKKESTGNLTRMDLTAILEGINQSVALIPTKIQKVKAHKKKVKKKSYQSRI